MRFLFCVEFFYPSVGGAQEVMKQIASRLVKNGHQVTVATSHLEERVVSHVDGIEILSFPISGNNVKGMLGELEAYRRFVLKHEYDILFIYAAQQWTFDALWEIFPSIPAKKIFVPCGFSALLKADYQNYFAQLPKILEQCDALIFHADHYRDFDFARAHHLKNCVLIPNGADNREFETPPETNFRSAHHIPANDFLLITVGSLNGAKGHLEIAQALTLLNTEKNVTLILNGNEMPRTKRPRTAKALLKKLQTSSLRSLLCTAKNLCSRILTEVGVCQSYSSNLSKIAEETNQGRYGKNKKIILCNLSRAELLQCYFTADLFVFASHIEYSPLVLYEACAAGLPFLSVPVGNAEEIAEWTGGGKICPAPKDKNGLTKVAPSVLANAITSMMEDEHTLKSLKEAGRNAWKNKFNWDHLVSKYEEVFYGALKT